MEDIYSIIHRKKERLKKLNDFNYITTMSDVKRNNEIYRLKGYIEALNDVKNKKIYTQEMDILERIYKNADENIKQENKRLKSYNKLCIKSSFTTRKLNSLNSILTELEEWLKETRINSAFIDEQTIMEVQLKIQELKEKYK